jgi:hypothetical protein
LLLDLPHLPEIIPALFAESPNSGAFARLDALG